MPLPAFYSGSAVAATFPFASLGLVFAGTTPIPLQAEQGMRSCPFAPVPPHSGHFFSGFGMVTTPLPRQAEQVIRVYGCTPVAPQNAHFWRGSLTLTVHLPLHTGQLESADITQKGSMPLPSQKGHLISACPCCRLRTFTGMRATTFWG